LPDFGQKGAENEPNSKMRKWISFKNKRNCILTNWYLLIGFDCDLKFCKKRTVRNGTIPFLGDQFHLSSIP
jgi:hypothetical protein